MGHDPNFKRTGILYIYLAEDIGPASFAMEPINLKDRDMESPMKQNLIHFSPVRVKLQHNSKNSNLYIIKQC